MKVFIPILLAITLLSCGREPSQPNPVDISMTEIVWKGTTDQDSYLLQTHNDVMACLLKYGYSRPGYPKVIVVKDEFLCGGELARGCATESQIYVAEFYLYTWTVFSHETVHWTTKQWNEAHSTEYFIDCGSYIPYYGHVPPPDIPRH